MKQHSSKDLERRAFVLCSLLLTFEGFSTDRLTTKTLFRGTLGQPTSPHNVDKQGSKPRAGANPEDHGEILLDMQIRTTL